MFGLFESETVVSVSTSVSRVIEDRLIPNSIKTGTIKGFKSKENKSFDAAVAFDAEYKVIFQFDNSKKRKK